MPRRRGVIIVVCLLLSVVLLLMAYGMLATQARGYSESRLRRQSLQAAWVARAGIDAALLRLSKDIGFPPRLGGRSVFSVTEPLLDPITEQPVGTYFVTVDVSRRALPADLDPRQVESYHYPRLTVRLRSEGTVLDETGRVVAVRRIDAELDMSPKERGQAVSSSARYTNPNLFRFLRWEDSGGM